MECTCNLTCNWRYIIFDMFYYIVNGNSMAKTLDGLQGNQGSKPYIPTMEIQLYVDHIWVVC